MSARGKFQTVGLLELLRLLVIAILLSGCATTVPLKPTVDHLPSISKIPLSVGIYYSPELRSYKYENDLPGCKVAPLGQASVTLFERLFPMMFHSAVTLESRQDLLSNKTNLSLVIEPDIENAECTWSRGAYLRITYHFTLYSPNGEALAYWGVMGWGMAEFQVVLYGPSPVSRKAAELAMEDAASKIAIQFGEIPAVKRLLQEKR